LQGKEIEILMLTETVYQDTFRQKSIKKLMVLTEQKETVIEEVCCIYKYQAAEMLYREMMQWYGECESAVPLKRKNASSLQIIGIYSPIHRVLQTTLAITMGQVLAEKKKVLYVNFECFSGLEILMGQKFSGNFTDLLYYYQCAKEKLPYKLEGIVQSLNGLHIIPPALSYEDYESFHGNEWITILKDIGKAGGYDVLILDLSEQVRGLFQLLESCNDIFTIVSDDRMAKAKLAQYELLLRREHCDDVWNHTVKYELPFFKCLPSELERLSRCELALHAKQMLQEVGYM